MSAHRHQMDFPHRHSFAPHHRQDERGRIIFTNSKGLPGVGLPSAERNEVRVLQSGTAKRTVADTTLPIGPVKREIIYRAPFTECDREKDYAEVWRKLEEKP